MYVCRMPKYNENASHCLTIIFVETVKSFDYKHKCLQRRNSFVPHVGFNL